MKTPKIHILNKHIQGFTLIEVMITLVIVAILVAISFPIYQNQQFKSHRSQAVNWLSHLRLEMERCASNNNGSYTGCDGAGANLPTAFVTPVIQQKYADIYYNVGITIDADPVTGLAGAGYTLTATEVAGHNDTDCTRLIINNFGTKTHEGASPTVIRCWSSD